MKQQLLSMKKSLREIMKLNLILRNLTYQMKYISIARPPVNLFQLKSLFYLSKIRKLKNETEKI